MLTKILSFVLAVLCAVSGTLGFGGIAEGAASAIFGVPFGSGSVNEACLQSITDADVARFDESTGYLKNTLVLFLDDVLSPVEIFRLLKNNSLTLAGWFCPAGLYVARCDEQSYTGLTEKCAQLETQPGVLFAGVAAAAEKSSDMTPEDPFDGAAEWNENFPSGSNWWLEAIDAREAWDYSDYFGNIKVGLVDAGFNVNHEDLEGKITFPGLKQARRNLPSSHGDHVAGIIAANHDNGKGIAGICEKAELVCVDWEADEGQMWINDLHILFGFLDVVKAGAKVINFSLGSSGSIKLDISRGSNVAMRLEAAVYSAAMSSLLSKGYDFVVVQSAGNGNSTGHAVDSFYNGSFCAINEKTAVSIKSTVSKQDIIDRIIVVAAAKNLFGGIYQQTYYSNVGSGVSIAAPGDKVFSCDTESDGYCYKSGTSMAAPIVTGVAALVWSVDPSLSGAEVKRTVCSPENTDAVAGISKDIYFEKLDYRDVPMVNASLAVRAAALAKHSLCRISGRFDIEKYNSVTLKNADGEKTVELDENGSFSIIFGTGTIELTVNGEEPLTAVIDAANGGDYAANAYIEEEPAEEEIAVRAN